MNYLNMMSENFFKLFFKGDFTVPPVVVRNSFSEKFPDAINVEWVKMDKDFEAIFYENNTEKIAIFKDDGKWLETKINLDVITLNPVIKNNAEKSGEIMNSIEIETDEAVNYEIIIRDKQLNRYLLILSSTGELKSNTPIN